MGRPKSTNPRDVPVYVRLTAAEAAALDVARGKLTRAAYFVQLLTPKETTP